MKDNDHDHDRSQGKCDNKSRSFSFKSNMTSLSFGKNASRGQGTSEELWVHSGEEVEGRSDFCVGDRVFFWLTATRIEKGTVRWTGVLPDDPSGELTVGVDLDNPIGTGTGKYKSRRLFYTKHGHASLVAATFLFKDQPESGGQVSSSRSPQTSPGQTGVQKTSHGAADAQAVASGNTPTRPLRNTTLPQKELVDPQSKHETASETLCDEHFQDTEKSARSDIGPGENSNETHATDDGVNSLSDGDASAATFIPLDRECSVCHEDFNVPKVLPCGHLLCRGCLISWMKRKTETLCPLCQSGILTTERATGKKPEDIADSFYTDHSMMAVVQAASFLSKQHHCKGCENNAALAVCLTCGDTLCSTCRSVHARLSATSHHSVQDLQSLLPERLAAEGVVHCAVHTNRPADMFCQTHGFPVCLPCARDDHRSCADVKYLEEWREETQTLLSGLAKSLSAAEERLKQKLAQVDDCLLSIDNMKVTGLASVDIKCQKMIEAVQACQSRLREQVIKKCDDEESRVGDHTFLQNAWCRLTQYQNMLSRVRQVPVVDDVRGLQQMVQCCVDTVDQAHISNSHRRANLSFAVDDDLLTQIEDTLSSLQLL